MAYSTDGKMLASADGDGCIKLWDPLTGQELNGWYGPREWLTSLAFSPDGRTLVTGSASTDPKHPTGVVRLWDPATGKERAVWREHPATVQTVAFSSNGRMLASASLDGTVKLWEADAYMKEERPTSQK